MRVIVCAAVVYCTLLLAACSRGLNSPGPLPPRLAVNSITVPQSIVGGASGTFVVDFADVNGPFTLTYSFTGGVTDQAEIVHTVYGSPDSVTVEFVGSPLEERTGTLVISIVDATGGVATD